MYTCRTCKLLKHTRAKRKFAKGHNGELYEYSCEADSIIDVLAEWHCPFYFWSTQPPKGFWCKKWKDMHGKHWL